MKKSTKTVSLLLVFTLLLSCFAVFGVSAAENGTKAVEIVSQNVYYGDTLKLMYAVKAENLTSSDKVSVKLYDASGEEIETITSYTTETVNGEECLVFTSAYGVPAQSIETEISAKAVVVNGSSTVAESASLKYSVLEYLHERLTVSKEKGKVTADQEAMYEGLLDYASRAEKVLTDKTAEEKIANYSYVSVMNGTVGAENSVLYKNGTVVKGFTHSIASPKYTVIWQVDEFDKSGNYIDSYALTDAEFQTNGYTVTDKNAVISARENKITEAECLEQVGAFGNTNNAFNSTNRASVRYAIPVKPGAKVTFSGDGNTYKFAIYLTDNPENVFISGTKTFDSGWLNETGKGKGHIKEYTIPEDKIFTETNKTVYLVLVFAKQNNVALTQAEIEALPGYFTVEGEKQFVLPDRGTLTDKEYNAQPAHWGSAVASNVTSDTRMRISFTVKMQAGTRVKFIGKKSIYKWAVVESLNTASVNNPVDSGWNTNWANPDADYISTLNGSYLVLTLSYIATTTNSQGEVVAKSMDHDLIDTLHTMFKVEGQKYVENAKSSAVEQKNYAVKSVNHRGFGTAPENTLEAYRLSAHNGFTMVECDVSFTKDGYAVLLHDDTIDRTSNGTGNISELTLAEVKQYDFGSWKSAKYAGVKIPTFEEFIALCVELNLHPYIEIKGNINATQAQNLVNIVNKYGMLDNCTWISFSNTSLAAVLQYDDTARIGYVTSGIDANIISRAKALQTGKNEVFIDTYYSYVSTENTNCDANVALVQNAGLGLEVYTVDYMDIIQKKLHSYVSGVTSNYLIAGLYR